MASALEDTSWLKSELTCSVCLDLYREPHLLPCGHTFCLCCLQTLKCQSETGLLHCPECREIHSLRVKLQKNLKIANITDDFRQTRQRPRRSLAGPSGETAQVSCDYCIRDVAGDSTKRARAVKSCLKCEVSMCAEHVQHHLTLPAFRDHVLVEPLRDVNKKRCIKHNEMLQFYWIEGRKFLCNACAVDKGYNRRAIKTMKNSLKDLQASLEHQVKTVKWRIRKLEKSVQEQRKVEAYNKVLLVHLDNLKEVLMSRLDRFLLAVSECARSQYQAENYFLFHEELTQTNEYLCRLGEVNANIEQVLLKRDPFQFIKEYMSCARSYCKLLKRPPFAPRRAELETEVIVECMEAQLKDFMTDLQEHLRKFITTACNSVERNERLEDEEEEEQKDENESSDDDDIEDEEQEERSEDEEEHNCVCCLDEYSTDEEEGMIHGLHPYGGTYPTPVSIS